MRKFPIGFSAKTDEEKENELPLAPTTRTSEPRKSLVKVYFPSRDMSFTYYNEDFDLKPGDLVYVEGKLEGIRGQVAEVSYSFKIKLLDYKKIIAVIDIDVEGDFYLAGTHMVSFDKTTIPFAKARSWFMAPDDEEYASGYDDTKAFRLTNC